MSKIDYKKAGVDIDAGNEAVENIKEDVKTTFTPNVLKYDVLLTAPSGTKEYYLEGNIFISEGYTA